MLATKNTYKSDVYRFDLESINENSIDFIITNVISWDVTRINLTKSELNGLDKFIRTFVEINK